MTYTLFKLNLKSLFAGLFFRGAKKSAGKGKIIFFAIIFVYAAVSLMFSIGIMLVSLVEPFFTAGIGWMYFALVGSMAFAIGVLETVFIAGAQIFRAKDNEFLLSMPIKPRAILLSRLSVTLAFEYVSSLLVFIPAVFLWLWKGYGNFGGIIWIFAGFALLPLLSTAVALLLAWLLTVLGGKMRGKNIIAILLSVGFLLLYMYGYMNIQKYLGELVSKGEEIARAYQKAMPPFYAFGASVVNADVLQGFIFSAWTIAPFAAVLTLLSSRYLKILTAGSTNGKVKYKAREMRSSGATRALIKKETAHFFSLPMVVLNTSLGSVFALVGAAALIIKRDDIVAYANGLTAQIPELTLPILAALAIMAVGTTNNLSASLVSLEGRRLWIIKSSPVSAETVLCAKAYTHILVSNLPCLLASVIAAAVLRGSVTDALTVIVIPQTFLVLTAFGGVAVNLMFPRMDWLSEVQVVKQSASAVISMFGFMALLAGLGLLYYFALRNVLQIGVYLWLCAAVFAAAAFAANCFLRTAGAAKYDDI